MSILINVTMKNQTYIRPTPPPVRDVPELKWLDQVTGVMDTAFRVPGTNFRFGLDPIIGLIPGVGELVTFGISGALLMVMARHGVSRKVLLMMAGNILLDSTIGAIPILGDLFDAGYKSNRRNLELLRRHYQEGKHQGKGTGILVLMVIGILGVAALLVFLTWKLVALVIGYFQGTLNV
ncbi:MAG: hypothetical protein AVDCRST_MAG56-5869 [uncultured Cytophagales bacterium]|uniref:DUF4112 domain-containing protein n=1 Tax=uncultured Cytophagales bacterium TaxID=158755 RepID=A0A6J4KIM3_9SPHI|nr:MAG: hypothetical protein AVDCRST_MAG56-5869 [uncultured Cytophagales bacterium]